MVILISSLAEKKRASPSQDEKKKGKKLAVVSLMFCPDLYDITLDGLFLSSFLVFPTLTPVFSLNEQNLQKKTLL